jgi:hypothetical protein
MTQLKLIGAGLPRTATLSQKIALEMLGLGPCYHMANMLNDLDLVQPWAGALKGNVNWDEIFEGCLATVDWPGAFFYRELIEVYPDAKVLLSVRDGDAWARSMRDTIWGALYGDTMLRDLSSARVRIDPGWRGYIELMTEMWQRTGLLTTMEAATEPGALAQVMERYNEEVIRTVPSDRLLVWSPADGWEPLCGFLGVSVPQAPFPRVNDTEMFTGWIVEGCIAALTEWQTQQARPAPG